MLQPECVETPNSQPQHLRPSMLTANLRPEARASLELWVPPLKCLYQEYRHRVQGLGFWV